MAGLALALELLDSKVLHSPAAVVSTASIAAAAASSLLPFYSINSLSSTAYCDAGIEPVDFPERWLPELPQYQKTYTIEIKPLLSAFQPKALATTTLRSLLANFLPLLEAYMDFDEDEDDEPNQFASPGDLRNALKRSGYHAIREISVITVRRILERIAVHYVSARTAWKLLKDAPQSAARKAGRHLSKIELIACVSKTAFRAHFLGVCANWSVQEAIELYRGGRIIYLHRQHSNNKASHNKELQVLRAFGKKTVNVTLKSGASLTLAALGAGCGAVLAEAVSVKPSTGTWIGLALGDFAGAILVGFWLDKAS